MLVNASAMLRAMAKVLTLPERERGVCCPPRLALPRARVDELASVLRALADPTRLQIVLALRAADEPVCICDFTAAFDLSQPTVSHHMAKLRAAGLVEVSRQGVWAYYRLRRDLPAHARRLVATLG